MSKAGRSVQYRYLDRDCAGLESQSLAAALRSALSKKRDGDTIGEKARARVADLEQEGQLTLWNGLRGFDGGEVLAGELILYRKGFDVPAIEEELDQEKNRFNLVRYQTDGKSKPIAGTLYFAVIGDHLGIIQSMTVTGRWLERYFTWLLKDIASIIEGESRIALNSKVRIGKDRLDRLGPARSMTIHAEPNQASSRTGETYESSRELKAKRKSKGATVIEILQLMGVGEDAIESIRADVPKGGRLEGDFLVYIKDGNRRQPISVGSLDHTMRHIETGDIAIERRGSKTKEDLDTLSEPIRVTEAPAGLDPNEAIDQIVGVLYGWARQGLIDLSTE